MLVSATCFLDCLLLCHQAIDIHVSVRYNVNMKLTGVLSLVFLVNMPIAIVATDNLNNGICGGRDDE